MAGTCAVRLKREDKYSLVNRYILDITRNIELIPTDIAILCTAFYDDMIYWKCSSKVINQEFFAQNIKMGSLYLGPSFIGEGGLEYELLIFPKGSTPLYKGYCEIFFRVKEECLRRHNIDELIVYFELGCIETNTEYRNIGRFSIGDTWSNWYPYNMKSSELSHTNYKHLTFNVYIDVLRIKYKKTQTKTGVIYKPDYRKNVIMNKKSGYEWVIKDKLLKNLIFHQDNKRFYSPNYFIDECWCLYTTPNTNNTHSVAQLYLRLIRLPPMIKSIKIAVHFNTNIAGERRTRFLIYDINFQRNSLLLCSVRPSKLIDMKQLIFNVNVEILQVYDQFDNIVSKRVWDHYGIKTKDYIKCYKKIGGINRAKLKLIQKLKLASI